MITFLKISWRNVFRSLRRTIIIALVIAMGYTGMLFSWGMMNGFLNQSIDMLINSHLSHIQIHEKGFNNNPVIKKNIKEHDKIYNLIKDNSNIKAIAKRVKSQGMINSTETSSGVMIIGIDPDSEVKVSNIKDSLTEGKFIEKEDKNTIYLGKKLSEKLKAGIGDKVVLQASTINNEVGGAAYRIKGIFQTNSPEFDKAMVFITLKASQKLFEIKDYISEFAIILKKPKLLNETKTDIVSLLTLPSPLAGEGEKAVQPSHLTQYEVLTWQEIMPGITRTIEMSTKMIYIFLIIILIAISCSIINTLFVVIFERFKELGIMKAIGTKPFQIFVLVLLESFWMCFIGLILGGILSLITMGYFSNVGINLSAYSKGMSMIRLGSILYPTVTFSQAIDCVILTVIIVTIASIYPAIVAGRIKIVKALKFV